MSTFLTGATGYLGSYVTARLLEREESLLLLVRASSPDEANRRLWRSLQLHMDFATFREHLADRIRVLEGDLTARRFGLDDSQFRDLVSRTDSIVHVAASLNRRSERVCVDVNLRGTLEVIQLARAAHSERGLRRFSHVSTVAVAGAREHETVHEDDAIDWNRKDHDPYARTKKFAEHLVRELLADVPVTIFRPSIVLGDSRRAETTQFDMVRAFAFLARLPVLPFRPLDRLDIVPADWVGTTIASLHVADRPDHDTYNLSAGDDSRSFRQLTTVLAGALHRRPPILLPALTSAFGAGARALAAWGPGRVRRTAALLGVFHPYLVWDTVFENSRAVSATGATPPAFSEYFVPLLEFARANGFQYPYREWPAA